MNVKHIGGEKKTEHTLTLTVEFDEPVTEVQATAIVMTRLDDLMVASDEEPVREKRKAAVRIDWDKACALKKAGWSNEDIARELHASVGTIGNNIVKHLAEYNTGKRENRCEEVSQDKD